MKMQKMRAQECLHFWAPAFFFSELVDPAPLAKGLGMGGAVSTKAALAKAKAARSKMEDAATSGKVCVHSADLLDASVFVGVFALARCCPSLKRA